MLRVTANGLSAIERLALDEALLLALDAGEGAEFLRIWEFDQPVVVLGRASRRQSEANEAACLADGVPMLRRCSGGTSILAGPGCLMYSIGVSLQNRPELRSIEEGHRFALEPLIAAIQKRLPAATREGICDLAVGGRKFSGNALRLSREAMLYHGTLLYGLAPESIARYLGADPPRQPDYRRGREHDQFVATVPLDREALVASLEEAFPTTGDYGPLPLARLEKALADRYSRPEWHERL